MSSQIGRLALADVIEQGWKQLQGGFLEQLKKTIEGLLAAERDRRVAERRERGEKVYRWGFTVRKCWQTAWGALEQVRVPRLRGREEIGLLEKYQRHALQEVLFALAVGGLSQRKVVSWVRRFLGGRLSPGHDRGGAARSARTDSGTSRATLAFWDLSSPGGGWNLFKVSAIGQKRRTERSTAGRGGRAQRGVGSKSGVDGGGGGEQRSVRRAVHASMATGALEQVELVISDGAEGAASAAAVVYPAAAHQLCLAHWFRNLEGLTPRLQWWQRRKFRREFWWML